VGVIDSLLSLACADAGLDDASARAALGRDDAASPTEAVRHLVSVHAQQSLTVVGLVSSRPTTVTTRRATSLDGHHRRQLLTSSDTPSADQETDVSMSDSTALVTGADKGIGKHIAAQLAAAGVNVWVGSRDPGRGQHAVDEIGARARLLVLDVTDATSIAEAARQVEALDILVNNAGISLDTAATPEDTDADTFRRTFETNVFGVAAVTNAFLPALRRSPQPRIVNISSGTASLSWSTGPNPQFTPGSGNGAAYRSSKTALNALTVFYSLELAEAGVKVNALAPGLRATDLNAFASASGGDPAEAASGAVRLALLADDGPTGGFFSWDGTPVPW
jgi:NAD(P)-dependent dehydrogenase (short-subunit alcohol dehydrogenase family)